MFTITATIIFLMVDYYVFQGVKTSFKSTPKWLKNSLFVGYWTITSITLPAFYIYQLYSEEFLGEKTKSFVSAGVLMNYLSKIFFATFLLIDDTVRMSTWIKRTSNCLLHKKEKKSLPGKPISRSQFLSKTGMFAASVPIVGMSYGILSGAHDYTLRKKVIKLKNLPSSFHGIKIAQLSDIHSGSFFNKRAVMGGVEMILNQKPELIFFTGDLVNNKAEEVKDYIDIFSKLKAPLGVYSILGNHDYGEYVSWPNETAREKNVKDLMRAHEIMGWDLLMNENRILHLNGDKLAILGVENWSNVDEFPKYGKIETAYRNTEEAAVKLLLSHDPSHWDAQIRTQYQDIDIMFAGHTHGMQCGIEVPGIKWSPAQYLYKQWAGLYREHNQYLYVNRGFGYQDFPGRIGMPPEITIIELHKA